MTSTLHSAYEKRIRIQNAEKKVQELKDKLPPAQERLARAESETSLIVSSQPRGWYSQDMVDHHWELSAAYRKVQDCKDELAWAKQDVSDLKEELGITVPAAPETGAATSAEQGC